MGGEGSEDGRWIKQKEARSVTCFGIGGVKPKAAWLHNKALAVPTDICLVTVSYDSRHN
jgi:hypothetical protein